MGGAQARMQQPPLQPSCAWLLSLTWPWPALTPLDLHLPETTPLAGAERRGSLHNSSLHFQGSLNQGSVSSFTKAQRGNVAGPRSHRVPG